jgi:hypothetical protein
MAGWHDRVVVDRRLAAAFGDCNQPVKLPDRWGLWWVITSPEFKALRTWCYVTVAPADEDACRWIMR